ncbi:transcriptional regulator [Parvularcula oceani]|uniref:transcriptional regulator n=1 Tax=Parvularcula oceani TaxID=1247963 RepID=UPI0004E1D249|nr:transcriptional regulator [Parvularcula oceani]
MAKKTMTLNLSEAEMAVLEALCAKKDFSKTVLLRQALRLYQRVEDRLEAGDTLFFENEAADKKAELVML